MKIFVAFLLVILIFGCSGEGVDPAPTSQPIVVAVLPDQSKDALLARHMPLLEYLESTTSYDFEFVIPLDYADLLDQFDAGDIDLAWFGGLTFTRAERQSQAIPLAFRDIDSQFTSCYMSRSDETRTRIRDFAESDFSFGPYLSTSGHLMPRYFLEREGIIPERFFSSTRHSSAHDQTARWVSDGTVTVGVANCVIVQSLFDTGLLSDDDIRIFETTPPYSDYVWAVNSSMDKHTRKMLLDALLALDATLPQHRSILRLQGANAYLPAASGNFVLVRTAAQQLGLDGIEN